MADDVNQMKVTINDIQSYIGFPNDGVIGVEVDFDDYSITRIGDAVGLNPGADFDKFSMYGGRRKCIVNDSGQIVAWYGDENYIEDGSIGQVMIYQPVFYYRVVPIKLAPQAIGSGQHLVKANYYISSKLRAGFKRHPAFYNALGQPVDYILLGAYEGCLYDINNNKYLLENEQPTLTNATSQFKFSSISGSRPATSINASTTVIGRKNIELMAQTRGADWHCNSIQILALNQLLFLIEYATFNAQDAIGRGVVYVTWGDGSYKAIVSGQTSSIGNGTGQGPGNNGSASIIYRGVENLWGNVEETVSGAYITGNKQEGGGKIYFWDSITTGPESQPQVKQLSSTSFCLVNNLGYISYFGYDETHDWVFLPTEANGTTVLPVGDRITPYVNCPEGIYGIVVSGRWNATQEAGLFNMTTNIHFSQDRYKTVGGRLVLLPTVSDIYQNNIQQWLEHTGGVRR